MPFQLPFWIPHPTFFFVFAVLPSCPFCYSYIELLFFNFSTILPSLCDCFITFRISILNITFFIIFDFDPELIPISFYLRPFRSKAL